MVVSDDELVRRLSDLERSVTARLAEHEAQLAAMRNREVPDGGIRLLAFRAQRKARKIPPGVRRRIRESLRKRRVAAERSPVTPSEAARRSAIVDRYLDSSRDAAS